MELHVGRKVACGLVVIEDCQRRDDRAAPRRHLVEVKKEPFREEEDFRRDGGQVLPRKLAEKGQIELSIRIDLRNTAEAEDIRAGLPHPRGVGRVSSELERKVGFHGGVDFARATDKNIPSAVGELAATDMGRAFALQGFVHLPKPMHVDDVVAAQSGIGEKLTLPVAVRSLEAKQISLSAADAILDREWLRQDGESRNFERKNFGSGETHRGCELSTAYPGRCRPRAL